VASAGWGGFLVATLVVILMYQCMINSISEMAAAMPHTGGAYSFSRAAMGPWGGLFVTGLAETIEYVMTAAVVVYYSGQYADAILKDLSGISLASHGLVWVWWVVLYAVFVALNWSGAEASFTFSIVVSCISLAIIVVFSVLAIVTGKVDFGSLFDISGSSSFLPFGIVGVFFAMPFAMWLFLGIEELPLAAEEAHDPERDIPRAGRWGLVTLVVSGLLVVVLNPAVMGSKALGASGEPLLDGFRQILPGNLAAVLSAFALIGLLASVQGIMFAYGRNMYSLSRAGYYPKVLSLTGSRKTPYVSLIVGAIIGLLALFVVQYGAAAAGAIVLNIAVWGAVLSYLSQMISFVLLRRRTLLVRPYHSPTGVPGAVFAGIVALAIFIGVLLNPAYTLAIYTVVVIYLIALAYFALAGRKRLVLSPEEEYALEEPAPTAQ
jgi:ethanolamine permease